MKTTTSSRFIFLCASILLSPIFALAKMTDGYQGQSLNEEKWFENPLWMAVIIGIALFIILINRAVQKNNPNF